MYYKIKKHVRELNYETTLDVVKRALVTCQMKEDAKTLIVKYYDCRELFITINQLRDENSSDMLLQM